MNVANLEFALIQKINNSTSTLDTLIYSKALQELRTNTVTTVTAFADLPTASASLIGQIFYSKTDKQFYIIRQTAGAYAWAKLLDNQNLGKIYVWGSDSLNGALAPAYVPTEIAQKENWCQLSNIGDHTLALDINGIIWGWGCNTFCQLNTGSTTLGCFIQPIKVLTNVKKIGTTFTASFAIKCDGTLWAWGNSASGQTGISSLGCASPTEISGKGTNWSEIRGGCNFAAGIKTDGTLWTWGANAAGQLGTGDTTSRSSPGTTSSGGTNWCMVSANSTGTMAAIKTDGTLWAWGCGSCGELGNNLATNYANPCQIAGTNWCLVSAGTQAMAAIKTDGTLWTWGANTIGQLGNGTTVSRSSPGTTAGGGTNWKSVNVGGSFMVATKTDGTLWTWGTNSSYQLGDGTTVSRSSPVSISCCSGLWISASQSNVFGSAILI